MKTLKQTIESIVQENAETIRREQSAGVELIALNTYRQIVLDEFVAFDEELAGTSIEADTTLGDIADLLYVTTIATQLTKLLGPQVEVLWGDEKFTGQALSAILSDLAVLLIRANYSREVVEVVIDVILPGWLRVDNQEFECDVERVDTLLKAIYLHSAPLPEVSRAFDIPTVESIETDGWWLSVGD